jgi:aminocarboxymuconate-semialdehyde decarboxylase
MTWTVDLQGHYMPDAYFDELTERGKTQPGIAAMLASMSHLDPEQKIRRLDERMPGMDEAGLDVMVLSLTPPGAALVPKERASALAAALNDGLCEGADSYPGRFLVLASLPFPHVEECVAELERLAPNLLVRGALIDTHTTGFTIDEPQFEPVYRKLAELRMPAVLHPAFDPDPAWLSWGIVGSLGAMVSTSLTGLRIILSGLLDRVPELDLVIPHLGGTIPYLTQRVMDLNGRGAAEHDLLHYLRTRIWTDSCSYWHPALHCALETFGPDRIMLGSDYPIRGPVSVMIDDIRTAGLDDGTRDAILSGTAQRWFGDTPARSLSNNRL